MHIVSEDPAHELMSLGVLLRPGVNEVDDVIGPRLLEMAPPAPGAPGLKVRPAATGEIAVWAEAEKARIAALEAPETPLVIEHSASGPITTEIVPEPPPSDPAADATTTKRRKSADSTPATDAPADATSQG